MATYTNDTKPGALTYTNDTKPGGVDSFMLKEDAFYLLLETGDKIVLSYGVNYLYDVKPA
jgi:hypothetical protein